MKRVVLSLLLAILITVSVLPEYVFPQPVSSAESSGKSPRIICRKTEFVEAKYSPLGELLSRSVSVRFEIYNNGSSPIRVDIVDRVRCINASTLVTLYGTPEPDIVENFGNLTRITWTGVEINASKSARYYYTAQTFRAIPISVNATLYVNNAKANVTKVKGFYTTNASVSDTLTFKLTLRDTQTPLYISNNKTLVQPLMCTVSVAFKNDYFSGVRTTPKANSTSFLGDKTMPTWILFLGNESQTVEASASIVEVSDWGEVPLDPISIQVTSAPEMLQAYVRGSVQSLELPISLMENFTQMFGELNETTNQMGLTLSDIAYSLEQNTTRLVANLTSFLNLTEMMLQSADAALGASQACISNANTSILLFMSDPEAAGLLNNRADLAKLLGYAVANLSVAYNAIDHVRNGNGTFPGLMELCGQIDSLIELLSSANASSKELVSGLYGLANGLYQLSNSTASTRRGLEKPLDELKTQKSELEDILFTFNSKALVPLDVEVKTYSGQLTWSPKFGIEKADDDTWRLVYAGFSNLASVNQTVYGLRIQLRNGEANLEPHVEVEINGSWQSPYDPAQLGLEYDAENKTLYLWPRIVVAPNSTQNLLVDWAGRPIRITVHSVEKPAVAWEVDVAELPPNLRVEFSESQFLCSLNQPHVVVRPAAWKPSQPPPQPEVEKSLIELLIENLQKPEVVIPLSAVIAIIILAVYMRKRKRVLQAKKSVKLREISTAKLLKEVDELERKLSQE